MSTNLKKSEELYARAIKVIPGATQTLSKGADRFVNGVTPKFLSHGDKAHVWDIDGNEYIDWPMGLGAILLGYRIGEISLAMGEPIVRGASFTLPHYSEVDLAEKLVEIIPCAEMVRFAKNGSDVTEAAVRIARAVTGRKHIAYCGYHGSHDWCSVTGGLKRGLIDDGYVHPFEYNKPSSLIKVIETYPCAAVIMEQGLEEPCDIVGEMNFLQWVKKIANQEGALFILDEIVTGFRYALGGAQELYNVTPDLCTMGKAMANGMPISVLMGKREYMQTLTEGVFFSNTFSGDAVAIAAALKTIEIVQREAVIPQLWIKGTHLREGILKAAEDRALKINLRGNPVRSVLEIPDKEGKPDRIAYSLFLQETIEQGVLFGVPIFPCWTHTEKDIEETLNAVDRAFLYVKACQDTGDPLEQFLEGDPIAPPVIRA
jgi:glutamate-1-semialdehyde aminotransferase